MGQLDKTQQINKQLVMKNWAQFRPADFLYSGAWVRNWFSNFAPSPLHIDGIVYNSVENYYQAHKSVDEADWIRIATKTPSQAKHAGRLLALRPDWENVKLAVMKTALQHKFHPPGKWFERLIATGSDVIIEWNNWGDKEWGVSTQDNLGHNKLGILLMEIRQELRAKH